MTTTTNSTQHEGLFIKVADKVSYLMGTPQNIGLWLCIVALWILLFALHILNENTNVLPSWFTSNAFNFPLNTVTTLMELYIGFLVGAAANRTERVNSAQVDKLEKAETQNSSILHHLVFQDEMQAGLLTTQTDEVKKVNQLLAQNTELTQQVHDLSQQIATLVGELHDHVIK